MHTFLWNIQVLNISTVTRRVAKMRRWKWGWGRVEPTTKFFQIRINFSKNKCTPFSPKTRLHPWTWCLASVSFHTPKTKLQNQLESFINASAPCWVSSNFRVISGKARKLPKSQIHFETSSKLMHWVVRQSELFQCDRFNHNVMTRTSDTTLGSLRLLYNSRW